MTYPTYSHQQLQHKSIARLKQIYSEIGASVEVTDRRCKKVWINAIITYQSAQLHKVDNQATAQTELNHNITEQAEAIAPEKLTTLEINSHHHEVYAGKQLVAYITYDHGEFVTQPWVVMVSGNEIFRDTTPARCQRFIQWHHKDGTLPLPLPAPSVIAEVPTISEISFYDQEAFVDGELVASVFYDHGNYQNLYWRVLVNDIEIFRDLSAARCHSYIKQQYQQGTLPVEEPFIEELYTTGNEIMSQIFTECEKFGFDIMDDGIYQNDQKLGEVGCTDGNWWFIRAAEGNQERVICDSALDAVWWLSMRDDLPTAEPINEYLQYRSLEQMSSTQLQQLLEHQPQSQGRELVTV
jgi:hypothetical protein